MAVSRRSVMQPTIDSTSHLGKRATSKTASPARQAPQRNGSGRKGMKRIRKR